MTTTNTIDSFIQQAKKLLPGDSLTADIEKNLRALAHSAFSKLDVVSREEFDAQVAVLHRSREKIEQLEQQLAELNETINPP
ncbi:MAG: accessory factor UbiK family protein [Oceanicoccus sp.]|uniref:accessory factor UbiK family protein n=1 Tax=Oceanicoccus sp. TaxID=2691044 RepID=UPI002626B01C|nr:accessory factor UbiK family protein [Oceanicoccus sp.]MCP3906448.1 accessory factor UbiK family protein [Oceanicoccus sp.]MDG1772905.1 accessory factor UbiK family protein [Oceanicoccus sp.]